MNTAECNAYAKINLSLDITGRREDGYHTVDMVMQSVSLCDRVRVTLNDTGEVILKCSEAAHPVRRAQHGIQGCAVLFRRYRCAVRRRYLY